MAKKPQKKPAVKKRAPAVRRTPQPQSQKQIAKAPRGPRAYDGFLNDRPQHLAFSVGPATHLRGLSRLKFSTSTTADTVIVINGGPGLYVGECMAVVPGASVSQQGTFKMSGAGFEPTGASASSPDTAIVTRCSLRLRNVTKAQNVTGYVLALNMSAGCALGGATAQAHQANWDALVTYVSSHPRTTTFSAHEMLETTQWDSFPVDQGKYHSFVAPNSDNGQWRDQSADPAMSTIVVVIPPTEDPQDYEATVAASFYARYRVTGPLAHASRLPPTMPLDMMNKLRDGAEALGSMGMKILTSPAAQQFVGGVGQQMIQNMRFPALPAMAPAPLMPLMPARPTLALPAP